MSDTEKSRQGRRRVLAARILAQERWPYVAVMLFALRIVEVPQHQLRTMAVDRHWRLYYSRDFALACTADELATVLLHECQHLMRNHAQRFESLGKPATTHRLWNIAGDVVINAVLDESDMPWPAEKGIRYADVAHLGVKEGMTTEAAFFAMLENRPNAPESDEDESGDGEGRGDSSEGTGRGGGDSSEENQGDDQPDGGEGNQGDDQGDDKGTEAEDGNPRLMQGGCGSCADGSAADYELSELDDEAPAVDEAQQEIIRIKVAQEINERQKSIGDIPGDLERWASDLLNPTVDWRAVLAGMVRNALASVSGRRDYSYRYTSRRAEGLRPALGGAILPSMRQPPPPRTAVVVDTSGSIDEHESRAFVSEIAGMTRAVGMRDGVTVIPCDSRAHGGFRVRNESEAASIPFKGGGGTDMRVGITAASELKPRPDVIVVLTDGYTPWPVSPPHPTTRLIVVLTEASQCLGVPAWATLLVMEDGSTIVLP